MPRDEQTERISDRIRYEHIRDAARDIGQMIAGRSRADLDADMILRRATIHAIPPLFGLAERAIALLPLPPDVDSP